MFLPLFSIAERRCRHVPLRPVNLFHCISCEKTLSYSSKVLLKYMALFPHDAKVSLDTFHHSMDIVLAHLVIHGEPQHPAAQIVRDFHGSACPAVLPTGR